MGLPIPTSKTLINPGCHLCFWPTGYGLQMSIASFLGPEKAMAPHSSTSAWKIPWTEEPGRLRSMGSLSRTQLSDFTFTFHFHTLEKEMATYSSVLVWRILGTRESGGLPSMGSHRIGHDWSDLAAAAFMGLINLLEQLIELKETFHLLCHWFIIKG